MPWFAGAGAPSPRADRELTPTLARDAARHLGLGWQLARHRSAWSAEDTRRFAADASGLTHFVRAHMERERRDLFEQASRSLSDQTKNMLVQAFIDFDARQQKDLAPAKSRMAALIEHYAGRSPAAG